MGLIAGTEGDLGDCVYVLAVLADLPGGPHTLLLQRSTVTKGGGIINRAGLVMEFVKSQHYIEDCRPQKPGERCDWNSGNFRGAGMHSKTDTLLTSYVKHLTKTLGIGHGIDGKNKWLDAAPSDESAGRVVFNSTPRYQNAYFPWAAANQHYGSRSLFVGTQEEHETFSRAFGQIEYRPTKDLSELAQIIAGCALFIGNQSCAFAIAEGLKKPVIQAVSHDLPDCIFKREGAQHCDTGAVSLPAVGDIPELHLASRLTEVTQCNIHTCPPGGWTYQGMNSLSFIDILGQCKFNNVGTHLTNKDLEKDIIRENVIREPEFFLQDIIQRRFHRTETARQIAGYPARTVKEMLQ